MIGKAKHIGKSLFKRTGLDIIKISTIEALKKDVAAQKRYHEAYKDEKSLIPLRPAQYRYVENSHHDELLVFRVNAPEDFDWLEAAILRYGYYEKPNVWSLTVDTDKRLLAELIQSFRPQSVLDIGCSNGPLLQALDDLGLAGQGVEVSSFALAQAFPAIKERIHHGDLLTLPLEESFYDVISGFDVFEHLNPNRIDAYLARIAGLLKSGGFVLANIPAFGKDAVFGELFEYYLADWESGREGRSYFETIHVDMHGYPMNGHLIWADTKWWAALFEKHGFQRDFARERAFHRRYDDKLFFARRSMYIFRKSR